MTCTWWLCLHPLTRHTTARGCTVDGCLCHHTATDQPRGGVSLAAVAWHNLYVVADGRGRLLVPDLFPLLLAEEADGRYR